MSVKSVIFGGSGFVGTSLVGHLRKSDELSDYFIIDKREPTDPTESNYFYADVSCKHDILKAVAPLNLSSNDVFINLAAEHRDDVAPESLYYDVNVKGAKNVCHVASELGINTIIFTSSVAVYGFTTGVCDEDSALNPFNEYGRSKVQAELEYLKWQAEDPLKRRLVIIRPTVIFGEGNRGNIYSFFKFINSGYFIMIGSGKNKKSIAYVENVSKFIQFNILGRSGVYVSNYVDQPSFSVGELVSLARKSMNNYSVFSFFYIPVKLALPLARGLDFLSRYCGFNFPLSEIRVKKFTAETLFSSNYEKTGFVPPVKLDEAIKRTISHEFG